LNHRPGMSSLGCLQVRRSRKMNEYRSDFSFKIEEVLTLWLMTG
jgi:hypothetical protein